MSDPYYSHRTDEIMRLWDSESSIAAERTGLSALCKSAIIEETNATESRIAENHLDLYEGHHLQDKVFLKKLLQIIQTRYPDKHRYPLVDIIKYWLKINEDYDPAPDLHVLN